MKKNKVQQTANIVIALVLTLSMTSYADVVCVVAKV